MMPRMYSKELSGVDLAKTKSKVKTKRTSLALSSTSANKLSSSKSGKLVTNSEAAFKGYV